MIVIFKGTDTNAIQATCDRFGIVGLLTVLDHHEGNTHCSVSHTQAENVARAFCDGSFVPPFNDGTVLFYSQSRY